MQNTLNLQNILAVHEYNQLYRMYVHLYVTSNTDDTYTHV